MNVAQAQSQYETAAAQIPLIESQIAQTENALSILLGRNPGPIPRGKSIYELALPAVPAGVPSQLLERRPDLAAGRADPDRRQRADRRRQGAVLPDDLADRRARQLEHGSVEPVQGADARLELRGPDRRARSSRSARSAGRSRRPRPAQQAALLNYQLSIQNAFADVDNALVASQKLKEQLAAQERLVAALKDYARLAKLQYDGGYTSYSTVLQAEQALFPAELNLALVRAQVSRRRSTSTRRWAAAGSHRQTSVQPPDAKAPAAPISQAQSARTAGSNRIASKFSSRVTLSIVNVYRVTDRR